ncbi:GTP-sensing pleiotropic transcriptional regulator CodY [Anaerotalea alkaliphila]|uniref:Global transcriptional regulator CodY n=1 Tax=Anaerotalea alkaliphila TaxID=2662126 RepID=A0A7X5KKZ1_9FIRM|nr:GTP-sensing pleiotropic transcriptional regulator CodY [Anaerotalea alkaliphila]
MSVQLLDRTRKINKLLQKTGTQRVIFTDICEVMSDILESNVLVLSKKGKLLAVYDRSVIDSIDELLVDEIGNLIDEQLNERLLNILSTKENVNLATLGFDPGLTTGNYIGMVVPIDIAGERLGTLFLYRQQEGYDIEDIILGEYGATVVGLEIMRSINEENSEEARKTNVVKSAISTLSFSEQEAIKHIFEELDGPEGILVASKVADRVGITRSVIVNALRKFESAGVIESRSLGMKGTYIKVINDILLDEINKL